MGRTLHYRPGSFYRTDDRTGFVQRAGRTKKQWNNIIVDERVWEARQPQDLVKGVKDDQTVPQARPLGPNIDVGPVYQATAAATPIGNYFIPMESTQGFTVGDAVGVVLNADNGDIFRSGIAEITADGILLYSPLPRAAASGNLVVDYRIAYTGQTFLFLLTEDLNILTTEDGGYLLQEG